MSAFVTAGAGFLLAVLWFDLMFDVQVLGHGVAVPRRAAPTRTAGATTANESELSEEVLASIAGYYARVTTAARPMNRLIAAVMLATLLALVLELTGSSEPTWVAVVSLLLALAAIGLAAARTVPAAVRLGQRVDSLATQSTLARQILRQHLSCAVAIVALLVIQLGFG